MNIVVSAGVIVTDGEKILLGHATGTSRWDLPKGMVDPGESERDAAIRELKEETGIDVTADQLQFLGRHPYIKGKDLSLWLLYGPLPNIDGLKCTSKFTNRFGQLLPEFDKFCMITYDKLESYTTKSMYAVLQKVLKNL